MKIVRTLVVAAVAGLVVVTLGCGSAGTVDYAPGNAPTPAATLPPTGLGNADDGTTVGVRVGDMVSVSLHADGGFANWSHPQTSDPGVLAPRVDVRAAAVVGATLARFQAVAPGRAQLTSSSVRNCSPGMMCPAVARTWTVTVVVT